MCCLQFSIPNETEKDGLKITSKLLIVLLIAQVAWWSDLWRTLDESMAKHLVDKFLSSFMGEHQSVDINPLNHIMTTSCPHKFQTPTRTRIKKGKILMAHCESHHVLQSVPRNRLTLEYTEIYSLVVSFAMQYVGIRSLQITSTLLPKPRRPLKNKLLRATPGERVSIKPFMELNTGLWLPRGKSQGVS